MRQESQIEKSSSQIETDESQNEIVHNIQGNLDKERDKDITSPNGEGETSHVESKQVSPKQMQMVISEQEDEPIEGEVVKLGKNGKPIKAKNTQNPDGSFGNPDINKAMKRPADLLGEKPNDVEKNRWTLSRMLKKRSIDDILEKLEDAFFVRSHRYAPSVTNFIDLEKRWHDITTYYIRHNPRGDLSYAQSNTYDNVVGGLAL